VSRRTTLRTGLPEWWLLDPRARPRPRPLPPELPHGMREDRRTTGVGGAALLVGVGVASRGVRALGVVLILADGGAGEVDGGGGGRRGREAVEEPSDSRGDRGRRELSGRTSALSRKGLGDSGSPWVV
jgi:hypothetical protein